MNVAKFIVFTGVLVLTTVGFSQEKNLTNEEKLYGLSLFWQEVNYNFVYFDQVPDLNWDEEFSKQLTQVLTTTSDLEYYKLLQQFAAKLNDGHTQVYLPENLFNRQIRLPIQVIEEQGSYFIANVSKSFAKQLPIGTEITAINGLQITQFIEEQKFPYIASSTVSARLSMALDQIFVGFEGESIDLKLRHTNGEESMEKIEFTKAQYTDWQNKPFFANEFEYKTISNFSYVHFPSFEEKEIVSKFSELIPEINQTKGLVIDVRDNVGGLSIVGLNIAKYLVQNDFIVDMPWKSKKHIGSLKAWGNSGLRLVGFEEVNEYKEYADMDEWLYMPSDTLNLPTNQLRVSVPITILFNENTASSAENFLIYAMQDQRIQTVGQPSFGSTGQPIYFELPGKAVARICAKRNFNVDGSDFVGVGIEPEHQVELTLFDYISKRDSQLEKAIELLQ